jgi:hypothetical protein
MVQIFREVVDLEMHVDPAGVVPERVCDIMSLDIFDFDGVPIVLIFII